MADYLTIYLFIFGYSELKQRYLVHPHLLFFFKLDFSLPSKIWFVYPTSLLSMTVGQIIQTRYELDWFEILDYGFKDGRLFLLVHPFCGVLQPSSIV